ncbi:hypothetical protein [Streptococcus sp. zg-JUN1979]|uniref:hypothetical protein n=1 Tax=Streptococcus sp. zg-JUN1979 TaxID=3391450 RepID=UPI0039A4AAB4
MAHPKPTTEDLFSLRRYPNQPDFVFHIPPAERRKINYSKIKLLWAYHLFKFQYFTFEIASNIFYSLTKKQLDRKWFMTNVGSRNFPFSEYPKPFKSRTKFFYINKLFWSWVLEHLAEIEEYQTSIKETTDYEGSPFTIRANKMRSGKPSRITEHDYKTRLLVSQIVRELISKCDKEVTALSLNIHYFFPSDKTHLTFAVPDCILFTPDDMFLIEYDNRTETQPRLLSKILRYADSPFFRNTTIYFSFNVADTVVLSKRIKNFSQNVAFRTTTNGRVFERLVDNGVRVYALPEKNTVSQIAYSLFDKIVGRVRYPVDVKPLYKTVLGQYYHLTIKVAPKGDYFDYYATGTDDDFQEVTIPLLYMEYGLVGNELLLQQIAEKVGDTYKHIGLLIEGKIDDQVYQFDDKRFVAIYLERVAKRLILTKKGEWKELRQ